MSEPSKRPEQEPQPGEVVYTRLPNGEIVGIFELMNRERLRGETQMNAALLKPGDLLAMQYPKDDETSGGFMFKVVTAEWDNLGVSGGHSPSPTLVGKLQGHELPDEVNSKKAIFAGSGWGGSMRQPGILVTGRSPYFNLDEGQFRAPAITNFKVFRKDENDELRVVNQGQLDAEARKDNEKHRQRIAQVEELMKVFGFDRNDFKDSSKSSRNYQQVPLEEPELQQGQTGWIGSSVSIPDWPLTYEDERYLAQYEAGMAMGNQLAIVDKTTGMWMEFKYYNFKNEDILQVAFADLSGQDLSNVFISDRLVEESGVHASGSTITTFTSSGRYGIEAVNYTPSDSEIDEIFTQLNVNKLQIPRPDIQILPNNEVRVSTYANEWIEKNHPGLLKRIKSAVTVDSSSDGTVSLRLNGNTITLKNLDAEIETIMQHMRQTKVNETGNLSEQQSTAFTGRLGRAIGRFIRRSK